MTDLARLAARPRRDVRRSGYDPGAAVRGRARAAARGARIRRRAAVPRRRPVDRLRVELARRRGQARRSRSRRSPCPPIRRASSSRSRSSSISTAFNLTRFALGRRRGRGARARPVRARPARPSTSTLLPPHGCRRAAAGRARRHLPRRAAARRRRSPAGARSAGGRGGPASSESLYTRLFRSVCPVTGQPDYACVQVDYRGARIDRAGLLALPRVVPPPSRASTSIASSGSSPTCGSAAGPEALSVYARFTRRGGIDINPCRSTEGDRPPRARAHGAAVSGTGSARAASGRMSRWSTHCRPCRRSPSRSPRGASSTRRCRCSPRRASFRPRIRRPRAS